MFFKHIFSFFLIIWVLIFMISFINFNNKIIIFKLNISFSVIKFFIKHTIFFREKFYYFLWYWCFFMSSRLYPNFFLNSIAFGNLQRSIISRVSFSIIKIPSLSLKNVLYFFFFFCYVFYFLTTIFFNSP